MRAAIAMAICALLVPAAEAAFTVTGNFLYVDRPFTYDGFTGTFDQLPIRYARIEVINNATNVVIAIGETDASGSISIPVAGSGTADIVVRCFSRSDHFGFNRLRVIGTGVYSVASAVYPAWNLGTDLSIGTITSQIVLAGANLGNPFNMLDQMVAGIEYVKSLGSGNPLAAIVMSWPNTAGSVAFGTTIQMSQDDGYDDLVQLHELGHAVHFHFSNYDSPGGLHFMGASDQDPRLSFAEGFATYFGSAVRQFQGLSDPSFTLNCDGAAVTGPGSIRFRMRLETGEPFTAQLAGEADEGAVLCTLWDLADTASTPDGSPTDDDAVDGSFAFLGGAAGDRVVWSSMIGNVKAATDTTIRDLWNGIFIPIDYGHLAAIESCFSQWKLNFFGDALEPNDALSEATPIAFASTFGPLRTLYAATSASGAPGDGDQDWYRFAVTAGSVIEIETRYPNAAPDADTYADTFVELRRPDGSLYLSSDSGGAGRNGLIANAAIDASGEWFVVIRSIHSYRKTGSYDLRVTRISGPPGGCVDLATLAHSGVGKPGTFGVPVFTTTALPVIPSAAFSLEIGTLPPGAPGFLLIGTRSADLLFDQGHLYVDPVLVLPLFANSLGKVSIVSPLADPLDCGATLQVQAMFPNDPGAAGPSQTAQTALLTFTFGG